MLMRLILSVILSSRISREYWKRPVFQRLCAVGYFKTGSRKSQIHQIQNEKQSHILNYYYVRQGIAAISDIKADKTIEYLSFLL